MIKKIEKFFIENGIEKNEAKAEANLIVCEISGMAIESILSGNKIQNEDEIWNVAEKRAKTKAPIQHILGFAYFMGDKFFVNENVLIPRPETELLVSKTVEIAKKVRGFKQTGIMQNAAKLDTRKITKDVISQRSPKEPDKNKMTNSDKKQAETLTILDIGAGSGCIGIEISKLLEFDKDIEIMGVDISTDALQTAIKNMESLGAQRRVIFRKSDIFSGLRPMDKFNIIVSNPPYIPLPDKENLQNEVKNFEPHLALFAKDKDGIEFYKQILKDAKKHLKTPGYVLFELGINQAEKVVNIAQEYGFKLEFIEKDLSEIERVICFLADY